MTHGYSLTSKIHFRDLVVALKEHAFKRSEYPLVLSFEMHCDAEGQQKIAEILESELKDHLFILPHNYETMHLYPSPEHLKRKFIIKSKADVPLSLYAHKPHHARLMTPAELYSEDDEPHLDLVELNRKFCRKENTMPIFPLHRRERIEEEEKKGAGENRSQVKQGGAYVHTVKEGHLLYF